MADVEIYRRVSPGGMKIQRAMALHYDVQQALSMAAIRITAKAKANLAEHRETGASRVYFTTGDIDRWIVLEDPAALSIEYGHGAYEQERSDGRTIHVGASKPLYILSRAAGLRTATGTLTRHPRRIV